MKIKNSQIVSELTTLTLNRLIKEPSLNAVPAFALAANLKVVDPIIKLFQESRNKLLVKYTAKDKDGNIIRPTIDGKINDDAVTLSDSAAFYKEQQELLDIETDATIVVIKSSAINVQLSIPEASSLMWMVDPS